MLTKVFYSTMQGAPVLTANWGSLLTVLKSCLINGFNEQQVSSIVVTGDIATVTLGNNHGFIKHQVVNIRGADNAVFNADYRVLSVAATSITVKAPIAETVTGLMFIKVAPLGWTEQFTGVNKSVFAAKDTTKNRFVLRVDNSKPDGYTSTWGKFARVTIAEGMLSIDDFGGNAKAPTSPAHPNTNEQGNGVIGASGVYGWAKWYHGVQTYSSLLEINSNNLVFTNLPWEIVGDGSNFYFLVNITDYTGRATYAFTVPITNNSSDRFNCFLSATDGLRAADASGESYTTGKNAANCQWASHDRSGKFLLRDYTGQGYSHAGCGLYSLNNGNNQQISGFSSEIPFPNKPDNSLDLHEIYIKEDGGKRGHLPIIKWINNKWELGNKVILDKEQGIYAILGAEAKGGGLNSFYAFKLEGYYERT